MDIVIVFLLVLLAVGLVVVILKINQKGDTKADERLIAMAEKLSQITTQNNELRQELDKKLSEAHRASQDQFGKTANIMQNASKEANKVISDISAQSQKMIKEVTERLAKLDETNQQVVNFSGQLKNLQDILKNPKQRGVLGEYYLEETLKNVLPPNSYQMQYGFKDGSIVDAVVFVKEKIIPIDSKFSLENYERILNCTDDKERVELEKMFKQDLKVRIDETSKYVKPSENTMDFAFMFIPSEAIYYDLLVNKVGAVQISTRDLIEYAFRDKHVIIVSPTSFLAYLQTVLQGLRALQIEESAKMIRSNVEKLSRHMSNYDDFLKRLGASINTTVNHYNNAYKEFKKIDKDVMKITDGESEIEPMVIDKSKTE